MAIIKGGATSNLQEVDAQLAARVSVSPPAITAANGGRYRFVGRSGLITTIAAFTATAGHVGAFRWGSTTKTAVIDSIAMSAAMVTDFGTLQQLAFTVRMARSYTASHSSGTAGTLSGNNCKLRTTYATTGLTDARVSATAALTAGTHTIDTQPIMVLDLAEPGSAQAIQRGNRVERSFVNGPIVLAQDEGLVFANEILMGATGTAIFSFEVEWREYLNSDSYLTSI